MNQTVFWTADIRHSAHEAPSLWHLPQTQT
jgi:hypothetical protein